MAQTPTVQIDSTAKGSSGPLKICRISVANGAAETSTAIDFSVYGINTVLLYGYHAQDATASVPTVTISGTTVTATHANDIAAGTIWAIGN